MKIAYVYYLRFISEVAGVVQKIRHQKKAADTLNLEIDFVLLSEEDGSSITSDEKGIKFIQTAKTYNPLLRHHLITKQIFETVNNFYDVVILRNIGFTPFSWYNFLNKSFKLITEHHTKEIDEILNSKKIGKAILEQLSTPLNFSNIDGVIAVTNEIREYQIKRGFQKNTNFSLAIGNGIDVNSVKLTGFKPFDGKTLKLVFVASDLVTWHGIDRVIRAMNSYKGTTELQLHIVGLISKYDLRHYQVDENKVKLYGRLYGKNLDTLMQEMNLAIGSLAVHRNGLKEASSLKVREYTARGIPFIYAYDDIDLTDNLAFCQKMPANEEPIDLRIVVDFCQEISHKYNPDNLSLNMRNYALNYMDWKAKINYYMDFAQQVYNS